MRISRVNLRFFWEQQVWQPYILFQKINVGCSILGQEEWGWVAFTFHQVASEYHVDVWQGLLLMQRLSSTYQANRALFNKSTQIGTHVDFHLIKIFGYGDTLKYHHGGHSNRLKMAAFKFLLKAAFIHNFVSQQQLKFADKQVNNYIITSKHEFAI